MQKYKPDKSRKSKRKGGGLPHIGIERRTLREAPWQDLGPAAKIFYLHLKGRYNGSNNGEIRLPYGAMRGVRGCSDRHTIWRAIKELEAGGWIKVNTIGGLYRKENLYKLTFQHDLYGCENV